MSRDSGETPLTSAVKKGDVELVRLLLAHGGSFDDKNKEGEDVLTLVLRRQAPRQAFAEALAARRIDVSIPKLTPLDPALTKPSAAWSAAYTPNAEEVMRLGFPPTGRQYVRGPRT